MCGEFSIAEGSGQTREQLSTLPDTPNPHAGAAQGIRPHDRDAEGLSILHRRKQDTRPRCGRLSEQLNRPHVLKVFGQVVDCLRLVRRSQDVIREPDGLQRRGHLETANHVGGGQPIDRPGLWAQGLDQAACVDGGENVARPERSLVLGRSRGHDDDGPFQTFRFVQDVGNRLHATLPAGR